MMRFVVWEGFSVMDDQQQGGRTKRRYRLRYLDQDIKLRPNGLVFGRDPRSDVVFQDSQVSRRHARIDADDTGIYVEDLESANGIFVNGERISGRRRLSVGDRIKIGRQQVTMVVTDEEPQPSSAADRRTMRPRGSAPAPPQNIQPTLDDILHETGPEPVPSSNVHVVNLLGDAAEQVLALGGAQTAEALLRNHLQDLLLGAKARADTTGDQRDWASRYALKLAVATGKGSWFDYVVELHLALRRPMPELLVNELFLALRGVGEVNAGLLADYIEVLKLQGHAEEPVMEHLESLRRLAELK
jgi:pSer/pThr/pTyr-binding forkhead associated (FHA) protein